MTENNPHQNILSTAGKLAESINIPAYVVGGYVRDIILGKPSNDIDIMVEGDGIAFAKKLAKTLNVEVNSTCFGVGTGWRTYKDFLLSAVGSQLKGFDADCFPRASDILTLAAKEFSETKMIAATDTVPVYLRNKVTA